MLEYNQILEITKSMGLSDSDKANRADHELLTHARGLMDIVRVATAELEEVRTTLMVRRDYVDSVVWQINKITGELNPTLVIDNS